jgi:preprotein translocase subunit SecE
MDPVAKIRDWTQRSSQFYGDVRGEVRKVSWPGRDEVVGTTVVVIIAVFFFGLYLGLVDSLLRRAFDFVRSYFASA